MMRSGAGRKDASSKQPKRGIRTWPERVTALCEKLESRLHLNAADLDASFGIGGKTAVNYLQSANDTATRMVVMSDGRMVVGADNAVIGTSFPIHTAVLARFLATGQPDLTFGVKGQIRLPELGWVSGVQDMTVLPDGSIIAIGDSQSFGTAYYLNIQKFTPSGTYDPSWVSDGTSFQDPLPSSIIGLPGGKYIMATTANLWRFNSNGTLDSTFGIGGKVPVGSTTTFIASTAIGQTDGSILVAGNNGFTQQQVAVRRFKADGTLDTAFGSSGTVVLTRLANNSSVAVIQVGSDGTIGLAGKNFVARLLANGTLDTSFNGTGIQTISEGSISSALISRLAIQTDGSYFAAGYDASAAAPFVAHLLVDGSLDFGFGSGGVDYNPLPTDLTAQTSKFDLGIRTNGALWFAGGGLLSGNSTPDIALTHILADGTLDPSLGLDGSVLTDVLAPRSVRPSYKSVMQPDGKLVMGGAVSTDTPAQFAVTRLNVDGSLDTAFGTNGVGTINFGVRHQTVNAVALQADGKIVAVGYAENPAISVAVPTDYAVARFNVDGTPDTTFGSGGFQQLDYGGNNENLFRVVIQSDGSILASDAKNLLRLLPDGTPDSSFGNNGLLSAPVPGSIPFIINLIAQPDGKIILGGEVRPIGFLSSPFVERLNADGTLDTTFGLNGSRVATAISNFSARDFVSDSTGRFYVSGQTPGTTLSITRFTAAGLVDSSFGTSGTAFVTTPFDPSAIAVTPAGKILALGTRNNDACMLRLLASGQLDTSFGVAGSASIDFGGSDQFTQAFVTSTGRITAVDADIYQSANWNAVRLMGTDGETSIPPKVTSASLRPDITAISFTLNQNVGAGLSVGSLVFVDTLRNIPLKATSVSYDLASNTATFVLPPLAGGRKLHSHSAALRGPECRRYDARRECGWHWRRQLYLFIPSLYPPRSNRHRTHRHNRASHLGQYQQPRQNPRSTVLGWNYFHHSGSHLQLRRYYL